MNEARVSCSHGIHPWWDCDDCRASSRYGVKFKGTGWTPKHHFDVGDLPPYDEVQDAKKEHL